MSDANEPRFRVFATADIGDAAFARLRQRGYEVEVYPDSAPPPKSLIVEKVRSGIDGLITTLRDKIDAEIFEAGKGTLKAVAQYAVGFDNINRADANHYKIPFTNTADVLTEATGEFAFFALAALARKLWSAEHLVRENKWGYWHPYLPFLGDEVTGKTIGILGTGRIGQAVIKKCIGFDMNILCYEALGPNAKADCRCAAADGSPLQERNAAGAHFDQVCFARRGAEPERLRQYSRASAARR